MADEKPKRVTITFEGHPIMLEGLMRTPPRIHTSFKILDVRVVGTLVKKKEFEDSVKWTIEIDQMSIDPPTPKPLWKVFADEEKRKQKGNPNGKRSKRRARKPTSDEVGIKYDHNGYPGS